MKKLAIVLILALFTLTGCSTTTTPTSQQNNAIQQNPQPQQNPSQQAEPQPESQPQQGQTKKLSVNLYFPDNQAQYLVRVKRDVSVADGAVVKAIIAELQKGDPKYGKVMPAEAKLLRAWVKDGIVTLDFSKEFQEKHWGGSSGESMTLYSIVNSLTDIKDVTGVQFYLEGKAQESILGHADTSRPLTRNNSFLKD